MNRRKKLRIIIVGMVTFGILILSITFGIFQQNWSQNTDILLTSVYDEILTNNERMLRYKLERAQNRLSVYKIEVSGILKTPEVPNIFNITYDVSIPIFSNIDEKRGYLGNFTCYFSVWKLVEIWLLEIMVIMTSFSFIYFASKRFLEEQLKIDLHARKNSELAEIASKMAHDIRSPLSLLNAITSRVDLDIAEIHQMIKIAVNRINLIANDLLNQKKEKSKIQIIDDIDALISNIIAEKRIEHQSHNINFLHTVEIRKGNPIVGNKVELIRIFSNIINNAVEAANSGGLVQVHLRQTNGKIEISFEDNGHGISQEILQQIGSSEVTTKETGNGLGLFFAKRYLLSIGAALTIRSEINRGTRVIVTFPVF